MELVCKPLMNGIMAYWSEVKNTASYNVTLYINNQAISKKINPRTELYCTFNGLAAIDGITDNTIATAVRTEGWSIDGDNRYLGKNSGLDYYIKVEAEDRDGNIIEKSEKVKCEVREF
jgi:hypothetical protein